MSISGCEKRPSLVTAVTASFNVLSEPFRSSLFALPLGQFRPKLTRPQRSDHTRRDPEIQIIGSHDASRLISNSQFLTTLRGRDQLTSTTKSFVISPGACVDHRVLREEIPHFQEFPASRNRAARETSRSGDSAQREERGPEVTISQVTSQ